MTREAIEQILLQSLESLNQIAAEEGGSIRVGLDVPLFGPEAEIDSISLVTLIVEVETALKDQHGLTISLTDDQALARPISPFRDVQTLIDYILEVAGPNP